MLCSGAFKWERKHWVGRAAAARQLLFISVTPAIPLSHYNTHALLYPTCSEIQEWFNNGTEVIRDRQLEFFINSCLIEPLLFPHEFLVVQTCKSHLGIPGGLVVGCFFCAMRAILHWIHSTLVESRVYSGYWERSSWRERIYLSFVSAKICVFFHSNHLSLCDFICSVSQCSALCLLFCLAIISVL